MLSFIISKLLFTSHRIFIKTYFYKSKVYSVNFIQIKKMTIYKTSITNWDTK